MFARTWISWTDSWFGVTTAAPPHVWLLTLTPSIVKLFDESRCPLALMGTWFSVWKIDEFEPPGPVVLGSPTEFPLPDRAPSP